MRSAGVVGRGLAAFALGTVVAASGVISHRERAKADTGQIAGMAMIPYAPASEYPRVRGIGVNTASFEIYWEADTSTSDSVHRGNHTQPDAALIADIRNAKNVGLQTTLTPKVWCGTCEYGWRGEITPSDPDAFLTSYRQMINYYARLGQQSGLDILFLGSEMQYLQSNQSEWRLITADARDRFHGKISYEVNWDTLSQVAFWDALDFISISAYFPLTDEAQPSVEQIKAGWRQTQVEPWKSQGWNWFKAITALHNATGKDVLFGEVGYRSAQQAVGHPWDEGSRLAPDQVVQANAYQALLETFSDQPWFMGVTWWEWRGTDGEANSSDMSPKGKEAERFLARWWGQGWRPPVNVGGNVAAPNRRPPASPAAAGGAATPSAHAPPAATAPAATVRPPTTAATVGAVTSHSGTEVSGQPADPPSGAASVANLPGGPKGRDVAVAVAIVAVLGIAAAVAVVALGSAAAAVP